MAQTVKNLPTMQETPVRILGWEDPLPKGMTAHSSILAWRILWQRSLVAIVHGVTKSRTQLSNTFTFFMWKYYSALTVFLLLITVSRW